MAGWWISEMWVEQEPESTVSSKTIWTFFIAVTTISIQNTIGGSLIVDTT